MTNVIYEIYTLSKYLGELVCFVLLGLILSGVWDAIGASFGHNAPVAAIRVLPSPNAVEQALAAESAFAESWPGQGYVVRWWGWSPDVAPVHHDDAPVRRGDFLGGATKELTRLEGKISAQVEPWLRLVWIRGVGAGGVFLAAVFPLLALWFAGCRRAAALQQAVKPPSDGQRRMWMRLSYALAIVTGACIGAPVVVAMAPWIAIGMCSSMATLFWVRGAMPARIS